MSQGCVFAGPGVFGWTGSGRGGDANIVDIEYNLGLMGKEKKE
jgi:hypothetical protein